MALCGYLLWLAWSRSREKNPVGEQHCGKILAMLKKVLEKDDIPFGIEDIVRETRHYKILDAELADLSSRIGQERLLSFIAGMKEVVDGKAEKAENDELEQKSGGMDHPSHIMCHAASFVGNLVWETEQRIKSGEKTGSRKAWPAPLPLLDYCRNPA